MIELYLVYRPFFDFSRSFYTGSTTIYQNRWGPNDFPLGFTSRFRRTGAPADLDNTISSLQYAIELSPAGDTNMAQRLSDSGDSFELR
jgi:hypothetical protein